MMSAQQRRYHNIQHKKLLKNFRIRIKENRKNIKNAIKKYHKADTALYKFRDAKKHGLIKVPKQQKLRYQLMIKNGKTEYTTLLNNQRHLEHQFTLAKYGKLNK